MANKIDWGIVEQSVGTSWKWLLFSFRGRANRKKFWLAILLPLLMISIPGVLVAQDMIKTAQKIHACQEQNPAMDRQECVNTVRSNKSDLTENVIAGISILITVPGLWILGALQAKRFHDTNRSGWCILISIFLLAILNPIPGLYGLGGFLALIWPGFFKGTSGPNKYGQDPLQKS